MKPCWPEGDLRAYVDRELPLETQERIGGHLKSCADCSARYQEISARAARVSGMIGILPETATAGAVRALPVGARHGRQWAVAALALAAALAIGFVVLPKRGRRIAPAGNAPVIAASVPAERPAVVAPATLRHSARRQAAQPRPVSDAGYFLRLDDEPIETGTVVRVSAENGDVQAELILGPDGQAHAIRIVNNQ
jgi:anti-sigma factor RsiW